MRTVNSRQYIVGSRELKLFLFVFSLFTIYCLLTTPVSAQLTEYTLLEPLPLGPNGAQVDKVNAGSYIPGIFRLTLAVAGVLAVIRLIYAGILYMSSDAYSNTNEAKKIINDALWGLALTFGAWIIVATLFDARGDNLNLSLDIPRQQLAPNLNQPGPITPGSGLTQEEAVKVLKNANIEIQGPIILTGIQQRTVNELVSLKSTCGANCEVIVTSATGGVHAPGVCSHGAGYKADLKLTSTLTQYIEKNYSKLPTRSDGSAMYASPSGAKYAKESTHWDMVVTCP